MVYRKHRTTDGLPDIYIYIDENKKKSITRKPLWPKIEEAFDVHIGVQMVIIFSDIVVSSNVYFFVVIHTFKQGMLPLTPCLRSLRLGLVRFGLDV